MVDRTATKYVNRLVERVYSVYRYLKTKCNLPPLPAIPKPAPLPKMDMKPIIRKVTNDKSVNKNDQIIKRTADTKIDKLVKDNEYLKPKRAKVKATIATTMLQKIHFTSKTANAGQSFKVDRTTMLSGNNSSSSSSSSLQTTFDINNITSLATSTTTTSSTTSTRTPSLATTKASTTSMTENSFLKKKTHKVVVFFIDERGQSRARLEYH